MTQDMSPETLDAWLRVHRSQMITPFLFSRTVLRLAKAQGLDVDRLKADGIIAEIKPIPTQTAQ